MVFFVGVGCFCLLDTWLLLVFLVGFVCLIDFFVFVFHDEEVFVVCFFVVWLGFEGVVCFFCEDFAVFFWLVLFLAEDFEGLEVVCFFGDE